MSRLLITGSRNHQWTSYDSHALLIAVREILEKTHELPVLAHGGAPLFPEDFYAWRSGPVAPLLFIQHRHNFLIHPGELPYGDPDRLTDEEKNLIIRICTLMGDMTGAELGERVCAEDPWLHARGDLKPQDPGNTLIPKIAMGVYYFEHPIPH